MTTRLRRVGAAGVLLMAVLASVVAVDLATPATAGSAATTGDDTTPPAVGTCHDLHLDAAYADTDDRPAVRCSHRHSTYTYKVLVLDEAPNWWDADEIAAIEARSCLPDFVATLGGNGRTVMRSAYFSKTFLPTTEQRLAGATWIRCDVELAGGNRPAWLPQDLTLPRLPLPDSLARCRNTSYRDYALTVCDRRHRYRAVASVAYPRDSFPGAKAAKAYALEKCSRRLPRQAFFYEWPSRVTWRAGLRTAVCLEKTGS
ncbi:septum formation family protein [Nocardioides sp. MH1]|uniref:septum formation family protein n=1 Tax=Nocardioides sp. MH1 TaxID=3242490 RepID=UPI003521A5D9